MDFNANDMAGLLNQSMTESEADSTARMMNDSSVKFERLDFGKIMPSESGCVINNYSPAVRRMLASFDFLKGKKFLIFNLPFSDERLAAWIDDHPEALVAAGNMYSHQIRKHDLASGVSKPGLFSTGVWRIDEDAYILDIPLHVEQRYYICGLLLVESREGQWNNDSIFALCKDFSRQLIESEENQNKLRVKNCEHAFDSLILDPELLSDVRSDLDHFMLSRDEYQSIGIPWKRGYMFIGPPGTGKTKCLRLMAKYYGMTPVDSRSCMKNSGEIDFNVQSDHGKIDRLLYPGKSRPAMIILEDIDKFIAYQSDGRERDAGTVTLHDMLKALDGFFEVQDMLFVATTNYPNQMSEALINRPGRFDRIWKFPLPTSSLIGKFLEYHKMSVTDGSLTSVSDKLAGCSMAFAEEFVKSVRSIYHRNSFTLQEAEKVLARIAEHNEFCTRMFGKGKTIGF